LLRRDALAAEEDDTMRIERALDRGERSVVRRARQIDTADLGAKSGAGGKDLDGPARSSRGPAMTSNDTWCLGREVLTGREAYFIAARSDSRPVSVRRIGPLRNDRDGWLAAIPHCGGATRTGGLIAFEGAGTIAIPILTNVGEAGQAKLGRQLHANDPHHDLAENRAPIGGNPGGRRGRL
jgi:hypothetical protein